METCIICESDCITPLYAGLVKCNDCGHVYAKLSLSDKEAIKLYDAAYFSGNEYNNYLADKQILQKNFKLRFKILSRHFDKSCYNYLLEIGCAYGFFLDVVRNYFKVVQGIDITEDGIKYAQKNLNLNVIQGDFIECDFHGQIFDIVCMWDTIEHLRTPQSFLKKINDITHQGSLLAITTGDIDSLNARFRKEKWRLIHPPSHLHYFSKRTLAQLLEKNGFDIIYTKYCGFYRRIDSIIYSIVVLHYHNPRIYNLLHKIRLTELNLFLNLYDIVYVIARKR